MDEMINEQVEKIKNWCREIFALSNSTSIYISEEEYINDEGNMDRRTGVIIKTENANPVIYTILKSSSAICRDDIIFLKKSIEYYAAKKYPIRSRIFKIFGWWAIFAGAITAFSVCPVCGQVGCPVGIGTTGIIAGVLALVKSNGRNLIMFLKTVTIKKKK